MHDRIAYQGITFDDVLLEPGYSDLLPHQVDTRSQLTARIGLNIPILSSPMDTVTEAELAIALAQEGGLGVIHKNMSIEDQTREVDKVKRSENGIIVDPITLPPDATVGEARKIMRGHNISGVPITVGGYLRGILTRRDLRFLESNDLRIEEVMTKNNLVTAPADTSLEEADRILTKNKVEKLLLVDDEYRLKGLITIKDIDKLHRYPHACKDARGRLRVGAAVGVLDYERISSLLNAGVDVLVVDSAHGHSKNVIETVRRIKNSYDIQVVAGNVATGEGTRASDRGGRGCGQGRYRAGVDLYDAGGFGRGSSPDYRDLPVGQGGRRQGPDHRRWRNPLLRRYHQGHRRRSSRRHDRRAVRRAGRKPWRHDHLPRTQLQILSRHGLDRCHGQGLSRALSPGARLANSRQRQQNTPNQKLVPEGVEGRVPYKGPLADFVFQLVGGLRAGMGYCGARTIDELRTSTRFIQVTSASVQESHPHDIVITQEAPNYSSFSNENEVGRGSV